MAKPLNALALTNNALAQGNVSGVSRVQPRGLSEINLGLFGIDRKFIN